MWPGRTLSLASRRLPPPASPRPRDKGKRIGPPRRPRSVCAQVPAGGWIRFPHGGRRRGSPRTQRAAPSEIARMPIARLPHRRVPPRNAQGRIRHGPLGVLDLPRLSSSVLKSGRPAGTGLSRVPPSGHPHPWHSPPNHAPMPPRTRSPRCPTTPARWPRSSARSCGTA